MIHDEALREAVELYDDAHDYKAILYACLEGGAKGKRFYTGMSVNDFAIITVYDDNLCFYILSKYTFDFSVMNKIVLPYKKITALKATKFLKHMNILKLRFELEGKNRRLKVAISTNLKGSTTQKENLEILLDCLKAKIPEKMQ